MKATTFLSDEESHEVEAAIAEAERRAGAEIVCAVATESGRYDRAESLLGLISALIFLSLAYSFPLPRQDAQLPSGAWVEASPPGLFWLALAVALGFSIGTLVGSLSHGIRRLLVSRREMEEETSRAASHVFSLRRLAHTETSRGVLIYLSLFERRVVVLADKGALAILEPSDLEELRDLAVEQLRAGKRRETFLATIEAAAERLGRGQAEGAAERANELPNELAIFHPRP